MHPEENISPIKHLAHDLNNIFTRVLNSVELLKMKTAPSEEITALLNNIEASTYLASEIIEDALTNNEQTKVKRRINLNTIIQDIIRSLSFQLKDKIEFDLRLDNHLKFISGKYSDLYRVILNLVTNSTEAITGEGTIYISTYNVEGENNIRLKIQDTGVGIHKDNIPNIFNEEFSTKSSDKISGIGLSVVKNIVKDYSGSIQVESTPGSGTTFILTLPALSISKREMTDGGKSILIAEDENVLRELLAELLQSYNYHVTTTNNGVETLKMLNSSKYDLLIIDRKMPVMDGIECVNEIRKNHNSIPIIFASGSQTDVVESKSILNVEKILNKPYNFEEMLSMIRELIG